MLVGCALRRRRGFDLGVRDADAHGVPVRRECRVRSQKAGHDLEQQPLAWSLGSVDPTLPDIGGGFREATENSEDRSSNFPDTCLRLRAAQSELERAIRGCAGPEKLKRQGLTSAFDVREQMDLGLFGYPRGMSHRIGELDGPGQKCRRIPDAFAAVVSVPT
jgi:hypothetical protein